MSGAHPCDHCVAGCCREVHVLPTGHDVHRIAVGRNMPIAAFTFLRARARADGAFRIRLDGGADPDVPHYRLELAKVENENGADGSEYARRCIFLDTARGYGRCGIYDVRPADCAIYPTSRAGDDIFIGRRLPYCPKNAWSLAFVDVPRDYALHRRRTREQAVYERVIERWNEERATQTAPVPASAFNDYLANVYGRLAARASLPGTLLPETLSPGTLSIRSLAPAAATDDTGGSELTERAALGRLVDAVVDGN